ncbi:MAG: InlB B-repeat-containing protein [Treponema sp.]|nr:InlB B-repeat-containing protein [Treponema sp.]
MKRSAVFLNIAKIVLCMVAAGIVCSCDVFNDQKTYTVDFCINGGAGTAPGKQLVNTGYGITLPGGSGFSNPGYTFGGWNTDADGTGINYDAGSSYTPIDSITLYAEWDFIVQHEVVIDAAIPVINTHPSDGVYSINAASVPLVVQASVDDGGMLSCQWYRNTSGSNTGGTAIDGASSFDYAPPTGTAGTFYYYAEVTNTISDNGDGGYKAATSKTNAAEIEVVIYSVFIINLADMNEWELLTQAVQVPANANKEFRIIGNFSSYRWYLDGVSVGTSPSYIFNKPADVYQLILVVTDNSGESRSGRCRITAN